MGCEGAENPLAVQNFCELVWFLYCDQQLMQVTTYMELTVGVLQISKIRSL